MFSSLEDVANSLTSWIATGTTNTADVLRLANDELFIPSNGDRPDVPNFMVVITDGRSNNKTATALEAERLRAAGVVVVVVGVGDDVDIAELMLIGSSPTSATVLLSHPDDETNIGDDVIDSVANIVCQNEMACNSAPCLNGGTCTDQVAGTYTCRCPDRFTGPRCERGCSGRIDLVFVLDVSGSTRIERSPQIVSAFNVTYRVSMDAGEMRIGTREGRLQIIVAYRIFSADSSMTHQIMSLLMTLKGYFRLFSYSARKPSQGNRTMPQLFFSI